MLLNGKPILRINVFRFSEKTLIYMYIYTCAIYIKVYNSARFIFKSRVAPHTPTTASG